MENLESLAYVLALTRLRRPGLSQMQRVEDLLFEADPRVVYERHRYASGGLLFGDELLDEARRDIEAWHAAGYGMVSVLSAEYPDRLRDVREAPALIYFHGTLVAHDDGVCVVGSRDAGSASLAIAREAAERLVADGLTVVSGLAAGIDTAAHSGALQADGRTVAVMGTGLDRTYPAQNAELREAIVDSGGLVLAQFEPGSAIQRSHFPMRNAVMSGYGLTTFVVVAGEHSGTRSQARHAVEHGRGVILSRQVATGTSWGRAYLDAGQALQADNLDEVLAHARQVRQHRAQVEAWARELLS